MVAHRLAYRCLATASSAGCSPAALIRRVPDVSATAPLLHRFARVLGSRQLRGLVSSQVAGGSAWIVPRVVPLTQCWRKVDFERLSRTPANSQIAICIVGRAGLEPATNGCDDRLSGGEPLRSYPFSTSSASSTATSSMHRTASSVSFRDPDRIARSSSNSRREDPRRKSKSTAVSILRWNCLPHGPQRSTDRALRSRATSSHSNVNGAPVS